MTPRSYSLIAIMILVALGAVVVGSFIQNVSFFRRELAVAFPERASATVSNIDRAQVARIARAINLPGAADGESIAPQPSEVPPPLPAAGASTSISGPVGPSEPSSTKSTTTKTAPSVGR